MTRSPEKPRAAQTPRPFASLRAWSDRAEAANSRSRRTFRSAASSLRVLTPALPGLCPARAGTHQQLQYVRRHVPAPSFSPSPATSPAAAYRLRACPHTRTLGENGPRPTALPGAGPEQHPPELQESLPNPAPPLPSPRSTPSQPATHPPAQTPTPTQTPSQHTHNSPTHKPAHTHRDNQPATPGTPQALGVTFGLCCAPVEAPLPGGNCRVSARRRMEGGREKGRGGGGWRTLSPAADSGRARAGASRSSGRCRCERGRGRCGAVAGRGDSGSARRRPRSRPRPRPRRARPAPPRQLRSPGGG